MKKIPHDPNELLAVVDENNSIVRSTTRREIHDKGFLHREVYIYLINEENKVLLQIRRDNRLIDHSCAGHFPANQDYKEAAQREFLEELGVKLVQEDLEEVGEEKLKSEFKGRVNYRFARIFLVRKRIDNLKFDKEEIEQIRYYNKDELIKLLEQPRKITPSSFRILKKYILPIL